VDTTSVIALTGLALIMAAAVFFAICWPRLRRERIVRRPFPDRWLTILSRRVPFYERLPPPLQAQLRDLIKVFVNDKRFIGCAGQEIDDEIRITIAAQACLLTLNRPGDQYSRLCTVLVYPSTFVATREEHDDLGLVSTNRIELLGESWDEGKVVLAWDNVRQGVMNPHDGQNVVLHEFAHQLDGESGAVNGAPVLRTRGAYRSWARTFLEEYESLKLRSEHRLDGLLDDYGASDPAEFFAVATETFFERPREMAARHRELYAELRGFYRVDPAEWQA